MALGDDIADVFEDHGMSVTVARPGVDAFTEKIEMSTPYRISQPFIREFLSEASFRYDSLIQNGDYINVTQSGKVYLVMAINFEGFEDEIVEQSAFLYKCNKKGIILEQTDKDERDAQYLSEVAWTPVYEEIIPFLIYDKQSFDRAVTVEENWGQFAYTSSEIYISGNYEVPPLSRVRLFNEDITDFPSSYDEYETYTFREYVFDSNYRLYRSRLASNIGQNLSNTLAWATVAYRDVKVDRVDLSRFENVYVFNANEDVR